jgi:hypothetical protein
MYFVMECIEDSLASCLFKFEVRFEFWIRTSMFYSHTFDNWYVLQCISLLLWLEERYETVYTRHPGFQKGAKPLLALDNPFPMELPDNLFGEKWAFVQLPFSGTSNYMLLSNITLRTHKINMPCIWMTFVHVILIWYCRLSIGSQLLP